MRSDPAELMALAFPRLLSAIEVDKTIDMKESNAIVPIARPSLARSDSFMEILAGVESMVVN